MKAGLAVSVAMGLVLTACGPVDSPVETRLGAVASPLASIGVRPVPCGGKTWGGSVVDLMVADALTGCSGDPATAGPDIEDSFLEDGGGPMRDGYLTYVRGRMAETTGTAPVGVVPAWALLRGTKTSNCNPLTGQFEDATIQPSFIPEWIGTAPVQGVPNIQREPIRKYANLQLRNPGFQLCIAQSLREMLPGAAGVDALLLSESDQRSLLETIRERASMAVLDYAMLGVAFSSSYFPYTSVNQPVGTRYLPWLQRWALTEGTMTNPGSRPYDRLAAMGRDFAAAVQLHVLVTEELTELLARSRSARAARGGAAGTRAEEMWGAGSFHQRLLAAMLGGDPLSGDSSVPWERPDPDVLPTDSSYYSQGFVFDRPGPPPASKSDGWDWPDRNRAPFVRTELREPQVLELFRLARRFDRVMLRVARSQATSICTGFDLEESASDLYGWVEAELRQEACWSKDPVTGECCVGSACVQDLLPQAPFPEESYVLWERHRIAPEHARTLAAYLGDNLDYAAHGLTPMVQAGPFEGPFCSQFLATQERRGGSQLVIGNVRFETHPSDSTIVWLKHSTQPSGQLGTGLDAGFADRPLHDIAPTYTRNAVHRFPAPWEFDGRALAPQLGYLGSCALLPASPACPETALEAKRLMGSASALAAVRFMLMSSLGSLQSGAVPWEQARLQDYFVHAKDILRLINGAIGPDSVAVRPVVESITIPVGTNVQVKSAGADRVWEVAVSFHREENTGFWTEEEPIRVCAIQDATAGNLASVPSSFGGKTIQSLVQEADAAGRCAYGSFWSEASHFAGLLASYDGAPSGWVTSNLRLPSTSQQRFTFVAVRGDPTVEVPELGTRLLASGMFLPATSYVAQGQYIATGGTLGEMTKRAIRGRPENPTRHMYDGFGLRTDWVPPFQSELIGGVAGESSVDRYLALASSAADEAAASVDRAMARLIEEERDEHAMAAATERWQAGMREEVDKLCGANNGACDLDDPVAAKLQPAWFPSLPDKPAHSCELSSEQRVAPCRSNSKDCYSDCQTNWVACDDDCASAAHIVQCDTQCMEEMSFVQCVIFWTTQGVPVAESQNVCRSQATFQTCLTGCTNACTSACESTAVACETGCAHVLGSCETEAARAHMDCMVWRVADATLSMEVQIAKPVLEKINAPQQPAFDDFSGGALQSAFIEQWRALRAVDHSFQTITDSAQSANARVALANASLAATWTTHANQCDPVRMQEAFLQGLSVGCSSGDAHYSVGSYSELTGFHCRGDNASVGYSPGPLIAQRAACREAETAIGPAEFSVVATYLDALEALGSAVLAMSGAQSDLARSGADIARLVNTTRLVQAGMELEKRLTQDHSLTTSFGMYRRYRSYDVWRAKAWVENARRFALAARRAIDARYVTDLSSLSGPEPFVHSPSTWADDIYGYDLSLPAAVGLAVTTGHEEPGGIYPNKIRDYVANLQAFVMGFSASRSSAVAREDVDVVNLRGLKQGTPVEFPVGDGIQSVYANMGEWSLRCPKGSSFEGWVPVPRDRPASQACGHGDAIGGPPDRARMLFFLDPWGRVNDHIANEPCARRYNGRWGMLAVNFAGTGVKKCEAAPDPYACYSEGFIRYDLSHVGPAWITDYDGIWRTLGVPIGRIEGAKGLASELWLDPLKDGWNTSYINAVTRTEMHLRPLGGAYELEFEITPQIDIDQIERVQLLIGATYWVKQD